MQNEDAIILLGDPGMGKTTLFRDSAEANYTTVRHFLIDPDAAADDPLFLDALDEYRTIASGQDASSEVANPNTAKILQEFLEDPATGVHLKIAALEAIANSTENIGLTEILRDMVLEKHNNTWLRSTSLKAFAKSIRNDSVQHLMF